MSTSDREPAGAAGPESPAGPDGSAGADQGESGDRSGTDTATGTKPSSETDDGLSAIPEDGTPAPADPAREFGTRSGSRVFGQPPSDRTGGAAGGASRPQGQDPRSDAAADRTGPAGQHGSADHQGPTNPYDPRARTDGSASNADPPTQDAPPDDQRRKLTIRGWIALALGLAALLSSILVPAGLALGVPAIILGVLALRAGRRTGQRVPGALPGVVLGALSTLVSTVLIVALGLFWNEASAFQECQLGANTHVAQERCMTQFQEQLERRMDQLGVR